ncbi:MAG TPA: 6-phosphofructokinase, partial [Ignavibacteria bacterium]|nr:6-phosphofructokinase [Ignavibacteria bacterium]
MNVGILTSGGDCPGLNAVIRAAVRKALRIDFKAYGIYGGFKGIIDGKY